MTVGFGCCTSSDLAMGEGEGGSSFGVFASFFQLSISYQSIVTTSILCSREVLLVSSPSRASIHARPAARSFV